MSSKVRLGSGRRASGQRVNSGVPAILRSNSQKSELEIEGSTSEEIFGAVLNYFPSCLFGTILEDTITKMLILITCNDESAINNILIDIDSHIRNKYGVVQPAVVDVEDFVGNRSLESEDFKMFKMGNDRELIMDLFIKTYKELAMERQYNSLNNKIQEITETNKHYAILQMDTEKNKLRIKELRRWLRHLSIQNKSTIYDADIKLDKLEKSIEDAELTQETEGRYVDKWELARMEQHIKTTKNNEKMCSDSIRFNRNRLEKELIVHTEIETLVNSTINETMNEIQVWMEKYEKDTEAIDLLIQGKRIDYLDKLNTRTHLEETIQLHNKQMWDWTEFKRKRAEAQKYIADMNRCAVMIQAWWRGLLVRKQLGPYKVKKKKGGKKK